MQNNKNDMSEPPGGHKRRTMSLLIVAAVILLAGGGYLIFRNYHNKLSTNIAPIPYRAIEDRSAPFAKQDLDNKDYSSYQMKHATDAGDYIASAHYDDAQRVLDEITKNVPEDKIISQTYNEYWSLYKHKGDVENRKKYALLTAEKLRDEGETKAAAAYEEDAKK